MTAATMITGAAGGIGHATARTILDAACRVGPIGRREEALAETAAGAETALAADMTGQVSAHVQRPGSVAHAASKHATTGRTRTLAQGAWPLGIACGRIDIAKALTEMSARQTSGVPQADCTIRIEPVMDVANIFGRCCIGRACRWRRMYPS